MEMRFNESYRINRKVFQKGETLVVGKNGVEFIEKLNDQYMMVIIDGLRYDILTKSITIIE